MSGKFRTYIKKLRLRAKALRWVDKNPAKVRQYSEREDVRVARRERQKAYRIRCPKIATDTWKRWRERNGGAIKKRNRQMVAEMSAAYVASTLNRSVRDLPPEIIEAKRVQIMALRAVRRTKRNQKENAH